MICILAVVFNLQTGIQTVSGLPMPVLPIEARIIRDSDGEISVSLPSARLKVDFRDPFETNVKIFQDDTCILEVRPEHGITGDTIVHLFAEDLNGDKIEDIVISSYAVGSTGIAANICVYHLFIMGKNPAYYHIGTYFRSESGLYHFDGPDSPVVLFLRYPDISTSALDVVSFGPKGPCLVKSLTIAQWVAESLDVTNRIQIADGGLTSACLFGGGRSKADNE